MEPMPQFCSLLTQPLEVKGGQGCAKACGRNRREQSLTSRKVTYTVEVGNGTSHEIDATFRFSSLFYTKRTIRWVHRLIQIRIVRFTAHVTSPPSLSLSLSLSLCLSLFLLLGLVIKFLKVGLSKCPSIRSWPKMRKTEIFARINIVTNIVPLFEASICPPGRVLLLLGLFFLGALLF